MRICVRFVSSSVSVRHFTRFSSLDSGQFHFLDSGLADFIFVLVAQLNRATGCGPVGRGFESLRARHLYFYLLVIPCIALILSP